MTTKTILIIEDEAEIREGIRILLSSEEYQFLEAENGMKGLSMLTDEIDLVILDIMMPGLDGLAVCQKIRDRSKVPILFLTAKSQEADIMLGLKIGGDDYLTKPFSYMELNARIRAILRRYCLYRGRESIGPRSGLDHLELMGIRISKTGNDVLLDGREINLTQKEYELLLALMEKPNRSVSAKVLYEQIWQEPYFYGASNTVMVHIRNLRQKIEENPSQPKYIETVWGKGYLFRNQVLS